MGHRSHLNPLSSTNKSRMTAVNEKFKPKKFTQEKLPVMRHSPREIFMGAGLLAVTAVQGAGVFASTPTSADWANSIPPAFNGAADAANTQNWQTKSLSSAMPTNRGLPIGISFIQPAPSVTPPAGALNPNDSIIVPLTGTCSLNLFANIAPQLSTLFGTAHRSIPVFDTLATLVVPTSFATVTFNLLSMFRVAAPIAALVGGCPAALTTSYSYLGTVTFSSTFVPTLLNGSQSSASVKDPKGDDRVSSTDLYVAFNAGNLMLVNGSCSTPEIMSSDFILPNSSLTTFPAVGSMANMFKVQKNSGTTPPTCATVAAAASATSIDTLKGAK